MKITISIILIVLISFSMSASAKINVEDIKLINTDSIKEKIVQVTDDAVLIKRTNIHRKNENNNLISSNLKTQQALSTCYIINPNIADVAQTDVKHYVINPTNSVVDTNYFISTTSISSEAWDAETAQEIFYPYTINTNSNPTIDDEYPVEKNTVLFGNLKGNNYDFSYALAVAQSWSWNGGISDGHIAHFDIIINKNYPWGDATLNSNVYDLHSVIVHEFGHTFGLGDLYNFPCTQETMYGYLGTGEIFTRTLNNGDTTGLQIIYPGIMDSDLDGIANHLDNCPSISNPNQADVDADEIGDVCDLDNDNDGILNNVDNCPVNNNPTQADLDNDGIGDACDLQDNRDSDGDGVQNWKDNCPDTPWYIIINPDGCANPDIKYGTISGNVNSNWW